MTSLYTATAGVIRIPEGLHRLELNDLWQSIARIRRFGGQVNWTVLQHSLLVGLLVPRALRAQAEAHDLSEGLAGDVQSPIRAQLVRHNQYEKEWRPYEDLHDQINAEIGRRHGWTEGWQHAEAIVAADKRALQIEIMTLIPEVHRRGFNLAEIRPITRGELTLLARASNARLP